MPRVDPSAALHGAARRPRGRCPRGHALREASSRATWWECDSCRARLPHSLPRWRCGACDFDLCAPCFPLAHGGEPREPAHGGARGGAHGPGGKGYARRRWRIRAGSKALIGRGAFGCVYRGLDEETNRLVAVKEVGVVPAEHGEVKRQIDALAREIKVMQSLRHPNIVGYLGAEREGLQLRIYLEYVPGGSMAALLREYGAPGFTEDMARRYTAQVVQGLAYLHQNRIAHRDIKCENLLVGDGGIVKLADFGTSRELVSLAVTQCGTPCFMAPEVIRGTGHKLESDVWSLGCAVIEMLSGRPPFTEFENQYAAMMYIAGPECDPLREAPPGASAAALAFLRRCLQRDSDRRTAADALLADRWLTRACLEPP